MSNEVTGLDHLFGDASHVFGFFYRVELERQPYNIFCLKEIDQKSKKRSCVHTVADSEQQYTFETVIIIMSVLKI